MKIGLKLLRFLEMAAGYLFALILCVVSSNGADKEGKP
jgi:tetrahydromethanopterin S-methyltransferase subunit F